MGSPPRSIQAFAFGACFVLAAGFLAACDLDVGGDGSKLEGLYELTAWTITAPDACDGAAADSPERGDTTAFFVRQESFLGASILSLVTCDDLDACRTMASSGTFYVGTFAFDDGDDEAGWTGAQAFLTDNGDGTCDGTIDETRLVGDVGGEVRVDRVTKEIAGLPQAGDRCDTEAALAQAADLPCSLATVVTGDFLEEI